MSMSVHYEIPRRWERPGNKARKHDIMFRARKQLGCVILIATEVYNLVGGPGWRLL